ncbi:YueI family protein [Fructilactobacillus fructivorans]|uniref:DUF1694 domain-containing protein n=1 Tax=Fructilactobacillus fructivorans TaxID=1614 RepID=A0A0C1LXQ8_9LACO|nr:YueI family protein [Fructilactobacillus fructivorans]KID41580.1 hypothetical protein LfDm3_0822 [Fructilactobacillus fructivorans]KRK57834.1 hypothetical protein FC73_GL000844 [Fructilactobacillus fructivorans]KRN40712.1 hypothetical protein IV51_GL001335 [Fructilactobacillus fructivorans]KRN43251.1 hypothetical protein IV48_GL000808 [Fructilactobacillus fructivorans]MCT0151231.1 DUF1694 domain-containing protein [Fructilactobacillus fructivorans]
MADDKGSVQNRLDQAMSGNSPQINPDEQRKYLGTFRERVDFAITVADDKNQNAIDQLSDKMKQHPNYQLFINGNIPEEQQQPYMKLASQNNAKFTLKNNSAYGTKPDEYAVVLVAPEAIHQDQIDFDPDKTSSKKQDDQPKKSESWFSRLFHK